MGDIIKGVYVGPRPDLKGKTALLRDAIRLKNVLAQFDDTALPEAYGWHEFPRTDFEITVTRWEDLEE